MISASLAPDRPDYLDLLGRNDHRCGCIERGTLRWLSPSPWDKGSPERSDTSDPGPAALNKSADASRRVLSMASAECGHCGRLVHMEAASGLVLAPGKWGSSVMQSAYLCPNCHRMSVASESTDRYVDDPEVDACDAAQSYEWGPYVSWLPKLGDQREFLDVPDHIAGAASEATQCLSIGAYRGAGAIARAVIEAIAKDKQVGGKDLHSRIEALHSCDHIRKHTKDQAHEIRHFGNDMAHGDFIDPVSREEAEEVIELMAEVLDEVYQSPARLSRRKAARLSKRPSLE